MKFIQQMLQQYPEFTRLSEAVKAGELPAAVTGVSGIHKCCLINTLCTQFKKRALILAADEAEAQRFYEDLYAMGRKPVLYPIRDFSLRDTTGVSHEYERLRLEALTKLQNGSADCVIACIDAALQYTISPDNLSSRLFPVSAGMEMKIDDLLSALIKCGYTREDQIEGPGSSAAGEGLWTSFPQRPSPSVRVEFWGDEIDSVPYFNTDTQRRTESVATVTLAPCVEVILDRPDLLAGRIGKLQSSLRGKKRAESKGRTFL